MLAGLRARPSRLISALAAVATLLAAGTVDAQRRRNRNRNRSRIHIVSSSDGATVLVDGRDVGTIPLGEPVAVRPGEHAVQITKRGFTSYNEQVRVRAGQTRNIEVDLLPLSGVLRVSSNQTDVRVFVDGNFVGNAPLEFDLNPGRHSIRVTKPGHEDLLRDVSAEAGTEISLDAQLRELPFNPYHRRQSRPPRWYEKSWVWLAVGATVAAAAIVTWQVSAADSRSALERHCAPGCVSIVPFQ